MKGKKLVHVRGIVLLVLVDTVDIRWENDLVTF